MSVLGSARIQPSQAIKPSDEKRKIEKMNAKNYRKINLATRHFDRPLKAHHLEASLRWQDKFTLLCLIRAEVAPKVAPEILPDIVPPVVRFASRRSTDQGETQGDFRFALSAPSHEYGIASFDADELAGGQERELAPILPVEPKEKEVSE